MEQESLFTATKWDILEALTDGKKSPLQISEICKTSLANVSQQLRLLELGGIVSTERVPNRDKGQPRVLYSLKGNSIFLIAAMPGFVKKGSVPLNEKQKATVKIWLSVEPNKQTFVENAFEKLLDYLEDIESVFYDPSNFSNVTITVETSNDSLKTKIKDFTSNNDGVKSPVKYSFKQVGYQPSSSIINLYKNDKKHDKRLGVENEK